MDITTARHLNYCLQGRHEFDWNEFVSREELIRYVRYLRWLCHILTFPDHRIFHWIFLLDTAFVIFNNLPPRLVIKEMKEHVAAPEACFQAETADKCFRQIQQWMPARSQFWKISFRSAFENLCQANLSTDMRYVLAALGPLNLFAMSSGELRNLYSRKNIQLSNSTTTSDSFLDISVSKLFWWRSATTTHSPCAEQLARHLVYIYCHFSRVTFASYSGRQRLPAARAHVEKKWVLSLLSGLLAPC